MPFSNPFRRNKKNKPSFDARLPQQTRESEITTKPPAVNGKKTAETKLLFHAQVICVCASTRGSQKVMSSSFSLIYLELKMKYVHINKPRD